MRPKLLLVGMAMILTGFGILIAGSATQGTMSAGGVVFIGPFPIAFGSGPGGWELALGSVVIGAVILALVVLLGWRLSRARSPS